LRTLRKIINYNSSDVVGLEKQIEALKGQRAWSQKADDAAKRSYDTEEDAALAFADPAVTETGKDNVEMGAMIIHMEVLWSFPQFSREFVWNMICTIWMRMYERYRNAIVNHCIHSISKIITRTSRASCKAGIKPPLLVFP